MAAGHAGHFGCLRDRHRCLSARVSLPILPADGGECALRRRKLCLRLGNRVGHGALTMLTMLLAPAPVANERACQQFLLSSTAPGGEGLSGKRNAADRGQGQKRQAARETPGGHECPPKAGGK